MTNKVLYLFSAIVLFLSSQLGHAMEAELLDDEEIFDLDLNIPIPEHNSTANNKLFGFSLSSPHLESTHNNDQFNLKEVNIASNTRHFDLRLDTPYQVEANGQAEDAEHNNAINFFYPESNRENKNIVSEIIPDSTNRITEQELFLQLFGAQDEIDYVDLTLDPEDSDATIKATFTLDDLSDFLNQKKHMKCLPYLDKEESRKAAHDYLVGEVNKLESGSDAINIAYIFAYAKLSLELKYCPPGKTEEEQAKRVLNLIIKINNKIKLKLDLNYARIYQGKALMVLKNYNEAYKMFSQIDKSCTQTYLVDMAELVLLHGVKPNDMGKQTPQAYAQGLLKRKKNITPKKAREKEASVKQKRAKNPKLCHPIYIGHSKMKEKIDELALTRLEEFHVSSNKTAKNTEKKRKQKTLVIETTTKLPAQKRRKTNAELQRDHFIEFNALLDMTMPKNISIETNREEAEIQSDAANLDVGNDDAQEIVTIEMEDLDEKIKNYLFFMSQGEQHTGWDAYEFFAKACEIGKDIGDLSMQAHAHLAVGACLKLNSESNNLRAYHLGKELGDLEIQIRALLALGSAQEGEYSIVLFKEALFLSEKLNNPVYEVRSNLGLANAYNNKQSFDYLIKASERALEIRDYALIKKINEAFDRLTNNLSQI